jgi:hypothetical protein
MGTPSPTQSSQMSPPREAEKASAWWPEPQATQWSSTGK